MFQKNRSRNCVSILCSYFSVFV